MRLLCGGLCQVFKEDKMWQDIPNYVGYQANPDGRIRIKETEQVLKPRNKVGKEYEQVFVHYQGRRVKRFVHQLVARTFCPRIEGQAEVHHIDGDPHNNRANNLL